MSKINDTNIDFPEELSAGLRRIADLIDAYPELAEGFRFDLCQSSIAWSSLSAEVNFHSRADALSAFTRAVARTADSVEKSAKLERYFDVIAKFGPVVVKGWAEREDVCTRRQVGTKVVTKQVPTGYEEQSEEVPVFEWDCNPVLAGGESE